MLPTGPRMLDKKPLIPERVQILNKLKIKVKFSPAMAFKPSRVNPLILMPKR